jgi:hypothetical protein
MRAATCPQFRRSRSVTKARKSNGQFSTHEPAWNPTPDEIAAACLEIQKGWSEYDFARRQGKRVMPHPQASLCRDVARHRLVGIKEPEAAVLYDPG